MASDNTRKETRAETIDSDVAEDLLGLATMVGQRRRQAQEALVDKVAQLLSDGPDRSDRERGLIDDILIGLIRDVETELRTRLAERIARLGDLPPRLTDVLLHDEADVARPLLLHARALSDDDLVRVASETSQAHRLILAERFGVTEPVSAALIEADEMDVAMRLLANKTAAISQPSFAILIARTPDHPPLGRALAARKDLSPGLAHQLFWSVAAGLRAQILDRFSVSAETVDTVLADLAVDGLAQTQAKLDAALDAAQAKGLRLIPIGDLVAAIKAGDMRKVIGMMAARLDITPGTATKILEDRGGEALAVACKGLDLDRSQFTSVFLVLDFKRFGRARPTGHLDQIAEIYMARTPDQARAATRLWDRVNLPKAA